MNTIDYDVKKKKRVKRKLNKQKIFCVVSFAVILTCILFYGGRLIYFYILYNTDNKKNESLYQFILDSNYNSGNLNKVKDGYYFVGKDANNYLEYSNIMWRIVKLNASGEIVLVSDNVLGSLTMGEQLSFKDSYINKWLNSKDEENTGILYNSLNNKEQYLSKSKTCIDVVNKVSKDLCKKEDNSEFISLPSVADYMNTGNVDSFMNNGKYFYLSSSNKDNDIWFVNSEGKISNGDGTDIYGIKPSITLKSNIVSVSGDGSKNSPYKIEDKTGSFGGYVKLGDDIWRIYQDKDDYYKLVLNNYIEVNSEKLEYNYSNKTYYFNDTSWGSLAYYINNTYLDSLSYKDVIVSNNYANGYYEKEDYTGVLSTVIETKVGLPSVGDIILNSDLDEYYTMTGNTLNGKMMYIVKNNGRLLTKSIGSKAYVVPCITIKKTTITSGEGTIDNPFGME